MIEEIKVFQAVCDRCGYVCDEDEGEIEIRDTPDEMKQAAEDYEWREVNGRLLCPKCLEECCGHNPDETAVFTKKEDAKKYADGVFKRWGADSDTCIYESNIDDPETLKMIRKEDEK